MATKTVRPNSTVDSTNIAVTGAGSAHAALSDDSDASYIKSSSSDFGAIDLGLPDLGLPSGALIKSVGARARSSIKGGSSSIVSAALVPGGPVSSQTVSWGYPTTATVTYQDAAREEAEINSNDFHLKLTGDHVYIFEAYLDVAYVPKPVAESSGPTGTISDNTPVVEWTEELDSDGGAQTFYRAKVFDDATYGGEGFDPDSSSADYDSGVVASSASSLTLPLPLEDDTYKVYVKVAQTVHGTVLWSDWDAGSAFTVDAPLPNSPLLTITPEDDAARLHIEVDEDEDGEVSADLWELQTSPDEGETWLEARTLLEGGLLEPDEGSAEAWDYEVSNGQSARYRARSINEANSSKGPWVETDISYSWSSSSAWLKDPLLPNINLLNPVGGIIRSFPSQTRSTDASVHKVLGRPDPIVIRDSGGPIYESGDLVLMTESPEDRDAMNSLVESGHTLLLQFPLDSDEPDRYIEITGNFLRERIVNKSFATPRDETISWQEVDIPDGVVESWS